MVGVRHVLQRCGHLKTWSLAGVPPWRGLGSVALLEEVCHRDYALMSSSLLSALSLLLRVLALSFPLLPPC